MPVSKKKEQEMLEATIKPEDIILDPQEDDDSDMPEPQTKSYKKYLKCTPRFMQLVDYCVSTLPYGTILDNGDGGKMKLLDFVRYIEARKDKIAVEEMNNFIAYIAHLDFKHARPLMEVVENREAQATLWTMFEE